MHKFLRKEGIFIIKLLLLHDKWSPRLTVLVQGADGSVGHFS